METLLSLWLPIVLSAAAVFIASSFVHMALPFHKGDMRKLAKEDEVMAALRPFAIPPGDYAVPSASSLKEANSPEFAARMEKGPVLFMTVAGKRTTAMGLSLLLWFFYAVAVGKLAAWAAGLALPAGAGFLPVFRLVGAIAFAGYSLALLQQSIWYQRRWRTTLLSMLDGLLYALLTAAIFGWLWPR
ncbi:MAG TPA: hypothetical protein PK919_01020 [Candidatus Aminicenantes bacterium]|nr:hypothetical protein [Candidatus Aminicenantes bacterium]